MSTEYIHDKVIIEKERYQELLEAEFKSMTNFKLPTDVKLYILLSTLLIKAKETEDTEKLLNIYVEKILKLFEEET